MAFRLYFCHICGNLCVFYLISLNIRFFCLVYTFDSIIGNVRTLLRVQSHVHPRTPEIRLTVLNLHQKSDPKVQQHFKGQGHYDKVKGQIKVTP